MATKLLSAAAFHGKTLKNRLVLAPMTRGRAGPERVPTDIMVEYYKQRSTAGLLVTEATSISPQGNGWLNAPGIYTDAQEAGWKKVTDAVHAAGSVVFLQLWHMGRTSHSSFQPNGQLPVSASAIAMTGETHTAKGKLPYETPRALETSELPGIVADYKNAAARAIHAGFDGVEIHAANGYLLDQFLETSSNKRTDQYGGSIENRARLLLEVVEAVVSVVPSEKVALRLSPNGVFNDMGSPDFRELFSYVLTQLNKFNLSFIHVVDGLAFGFHKYGEPCTLADVRKHFKGLVIANCGYTQETAEKAVDEGLADFVAFGRPYMGNPDLPQRFANGWPLAPPPSFDHFYTNDAVGYSDLPVYNAA